MNKTELVQTVAASADISKAKADAAIKAFLNAVSEQLAEGNSVVLTGFGTFSSKHRKERIGRNPKTREEIKIPAAKVPHFKAGKTLKNAVNK